MTEVARALRVLVASARRERRIREAFALAEKLIVAGIVAVVTVWILG